VVINGILECKSLSKKRAPHSMPELIAEGVIRNRACCVVLRCAWSQAHVRSNCIVVGGDVPSLTTASIHPASTLKAAAGTKLLIEAQH
jgi:hypothetical protein